LVNCKNYFWKFSDYALICFSRTTKVE
jgi:hypothetical protein